MDETSKKSPQVIATLICTILSITLGTCFTWTSAALYIYDVKSASWIGSLLSLGALFGSLPTGFITDKIGRKRTLLLISIPIFISWLLIAFLYNNVLIVCLARFFGGMCIGAITVATPLYIAELADASIRGTLGTLFQVQITIGLLLGYIFGYYIEDLKTITLICSTFPAIFFVTFIFMPESAVYLCSKGNRVEAKKSLQWFRGKHFDAEPELKKICDDLQEARENRAKFWDIFKEKASQKGLVIALGLMTFQQMSGVNAILFYTTDIFTKANMNISPKLASILMETAQVVATLGSTALIDRSGRKLLLTLSMTIMCACQGLLGVYYLCHELNYELLKSFKTLPVFCLSMFIIFFSIGTGPIPWMIVGDIFDPNKKATASALIATLSWTLSFFITNQFQHVVMAWGSGATFILFSFICGIGIVFIIFVVPETKGKTIDEVKILLGGKRQTVCCRQDNNCCTTHV